MNKKLIFAEDILAKDMRAFIREVWDNSRHELQYSGIKVALDLYYYFCDTWNSRHEEFRNDVIVYKVGDKAKIHRVIKMGYKGKVLKLTHSHECFSALKTIYKTLDNFKAALDPIDVEDIYKKLDNKHQMLILFWQFARLFEFNMFEMFDELSQEDLNIFIAGCEVIEDDVPEGNIRFEVVDTRLQSFSKG